VLLIPVRHEAERDEISVASSAQPCPFRSDVSGSGQKRLNGQLLESL
jgi:hypothetical protein